MRLGKIALVMGVAATATTATAQTGQKVTGPIATYWMSAQTQTGMGMPSMGGGAGADPQAMMRAMMGGGGANKTLQLDLGSSQANPAPSAEHLPPRGLQVGESLPLLTPKITKPVVEREPYEMPREYQRPNMKILLFWGCGERARPGQPVVFDMSKIGQAGMPAAMAQAMRGLDVRPMQPPSPARNRTYGGWPNEQARTSVPPNGSLVGPHTIQGNYSPEIGFILEEDQDFLGPLNLTTNQVTPGGWANLGWGLVGNAGGYLATTMGGDGTTMVMWTSSETQASAFSLPDYLSNADITRLVANKALMGPATRTCQVPKEVLDAAPQSMLQMVAYGAEANFVHPPRPTNPKVAWNQEWAVKVRYRSATGGLLGMNMQEMMGGARMPTAGMPGQQPQPGQPGKRPRAPSAADILRGGILGGLPIPR